MTNDTTEQTGVRRLREVRDRLAEQSAEGTDTASARTVKVGDVVHAVATGLTIVRTTSLWGGDPALSLTKGDQFVVTQQMLDADLDRHGRPGWSGIVHDENAQFAKWGRVYVAPGPAPEGMPSWEHGSPDWAEARETARKAAHAETDPQRRAQALRRVQEVFGAAPTTSTITSIIRGDRAYEEQQQRISESAAAGVPNIGPSRGGA